MVNNLSSIVRVSKVLFLSRIACKQTLFYFSFRSFQKHRHPRSTSFEEKTEAL